MTMTSEAADREFVGSMHVHDHGVFAALRDRTRSVARGIFFCAAIFIYITYAVLDTMAVESMPFNLLVLRFGIVIPILTVLAAAYALGRFREREYLPYLACLLVAVGSIYYVYVLHGKTLTRIVPCTVASFAVLAWIFYLPSLRRSVVLGGVLVAAFVAFCLAHSLRPDILGTNLYVVGLSCALLIGGTFFLTEMERNQDMLRDRFQDLSDVVDHLQERTASLHAEAKQAEKAKTAFLAVVSHELRTPLNAILGFSDIIAKEMMGRISPAAYRDYARYIRDSGQRLLALVNDIIDVAQAELDDIAFEAEPVDLADTVAAAVAHCEGPAREAQVTILSPDRRHGAAVIRGDAARLRQAMTNVVDNAVKFSYPGGTVAVDLRPDPDGGFLFSVSDNGIGIAPEDIRRVRRPFDQVESAFARVNGGLGLGLTLSGIVATAHGGDLEIESEEGEGTVVVLSLRGIDAEVRKAEGAAGRY